MVRDDTYVVFVVCRSLAAGSMVLPSREQKWTNMKGIKYNLTNNQAYVRNYVFSQARKMVMKQTNGLYPAPLRIMEVCCMYVHYAIIFQS